jgi:hypothetical protein
MSLTEQDKNIDVVSSDNADGPHRGPIHETSVDFVDGEIDIGAFDCPDMAETMRISQATLPLNNSRRSSLNTILGAQKPKKPQMPSRDEALQFIDNYQKVIAPYVPVLHGPTFKKQVRANDRAAASPNNAELSRLPTSTTTQKALTTNQLRSS